MRYLTPQLSDAGQEPCLFPMEIPCSTSTVHGKFVAKLLFMQDEGKACFICQKSWFFGKRSWDFWEGQNKPTELKARLVVTAVSSEFILAHLLVNCHCFKRKWSSGVSLCIVSVQTRICFLLLFILWTALHLEVFFSSIRKQTLCTYVRTSEFLKSNYFR